MNFALAGVVTMELPWFTARNVKIGESAACIIAVPLTVAGIISPVSISLNATQKTSVSLLHFYRPDLTHFRCVHMPSLLRTNRPSFSQ